FEGGGALQVSDDSSGEMCVEGFKTVPGLLSLIEKVALVPRGAAAGHKAAACELVLEALVAQKRISRAEGGRYSRARHEGPHKPPFQYGTDPFTT
ncbi:MAG: magnesium chelatase, partial [Gemmatimonadetes bacterium]|nr:magnesium chelatase [Gemmatimonadota bacterium]